MKVRALLLLFVVLYLLPTNSRGQDLPDAEILTADSAWCSRSNNLTIAEILITGEIDTSRFDLVVGIRGTRDTLVNLPSGVFNLYLNNQAGRNEYIVYKVIEYQEYNTLENEIFDTLIMEVHSWPDMHFTADFDDQCSPAIVMFNAQEGYHRYTWDFGDGTGTSTASNWVSHTYTSEEDVDEINFTTWLRIETDFGCTDSVLGQITLYPTPEAGFFVTPELLFFPDNTVTLTNTTTPGEWDFKWDFDDGTINLNRDPGQHIYTSWGIYHIKMEWSTAHCQDSVIKQVEIRPPEPEAAFVPDTSGCPPLQVSFRNNSLYADTYLWDFDDGGHTSDDNPIHTFRESGTYHVKLFATNVSGYDTTETDITVFDLPEAMFEPSITETDNRLELITFTNNTVNGASYLWDFGDGYTSVEESPGHIYNSSGSFTVTLYAWSVNECSDTLVRQGLVTIHSSVDSITFPNVFKWNGTGSTGGHWSEGSIDNTIFHPNVENVTGLRMVIFTRHGHRIFETKEVYVGWDGYINASTLAPQGVYIYKAWVTYSDGNKEIISGDITFLY